MRQRIRPLLGLLAAGWLLIFIDSHAAQAGTICISGSSCADIPTIDGGGIAMPSPDLPPITFNPGPLTILGKEFVYTGIDPLSITSQQAIIVDSSIFQYGGVTISLNANSLVSIGNDYPLPSFISSIAIGQTLESSSGSDIAVLLDSPLVLKLINPVSLTLTTASDIYVMDITRVDASPVPIPNSLSLLFSSISGLLILVWRTKTTRGNYGEGNVRHESVRCTHGVIGA